MGGERDQRRRRQERIEHLHQHSPVSGASNKTNNNHLNPERIRRSIVQLCGQLCMYGNAGCFMVVYITTCVCARHLLQIQAVCLLLRATEKVASVSHYFGYQRIHRTCVPRCGRYFSIMLMLGGELEGLLVVYFLWARAC